MFKQVREDLPAKMKEMWEKAEDWEGSMRPTEKMMYWAQRGVYPWVAPEGGDPSVNPAMVPLGMSAGWNFGNQISANAHVTQLVSAAIQASNHPIDVDDEPIPSSTNATGDVDDTPIEDDWSPTSAPSPTLTPIPPLIPSKELGENPISSTTHPHLASLWQTLYNLSSTPNALIADLCNLRPVTKRNLNQTALQDWWWDLGDKWAGVSDDLKVQAITAGLGVGVPHHKARKRGKKVAKAKKDEGEI